MIWHWHKCYKIVTPIFLGDERSKTLKSPIKFFPVWSFMVIVDTIVVVLPYFNPCPFYQDTLLIKNSSFQLKRFPIWQPST